jgi:hypothetical protein
MRYLSDATMVPREHSQVSLQFPPRGGVSQFFRCEAPFLLWHEIECRIMPLTPAQKPRTPPRFKLLRRRRRILAWAFSDTPCRGNLGAAADHQQRDKRPPSERLRWGKVWPIRHRPFAARSREASGYQSGGKQSFASPSRRLFRRQVRAGSTPHRVRNGCACRGALAMGLHRAKATHLPSEYPAESHLDSKSNRKGT